MAKKPYYVERIGGIPTVLKRDGLGKGVNFQVSQHATLAEARKEAARKNLNAEYAEPGHGA